MKSNPKISIVFPNFEGDKKKLKDFLRSMDNLIWPKKPIEVIMVDNGSKDDSVKFVKENFPFVKVIKLGKNFGFAKAVNLGIGKTTGNYIFVTNNDVTLEKNCFSNLAEFVKNHPEVGVTGPVVFEDSKKSTIKSLKYNFYTGLFRKLKNWQESDWIEGCGMFFSKGIWTALSGFDESFFFTFEDLDFCLRVKKIGLKIKHCPQAFIWHKVGSTVNRPELANFKYYQGYKGKLRLILKYGNLLQITTSILLQFLVFAPYRFLILREKSLAPLFQAFFWNLKHLPQTLSARKEFDER